MSDNKAKIQELAINMVEAAIPHLKKKVEEALRSGAIDPSSWDESMVLPKAIVHAAMISEADQYLMPKGSSLEKAQKRVINNLKHFI